jgi:AcrR family transcriptional regulator
MAKKKNVNTSELTQKKILTSARQLFVKKGFEGTSISEIAEKAGINQSLIYHHFKNKEHLWKEVKVEIFAKTAPENFTIPTAPQDLRTFLEEIIYPRFAYYDSHPDFLRMMTWQKLENMKERLKGAGGLSPYQWKDGIVYLQKAQKIRPELDPDMVIVWLASAVAGAFNEDYIGLNKDESKKKAYLAMIIDCLERGLEVAT